MQLVVRHNELNSTHSPFYIKSFAFNFVEIDIAQLMFSKGIRTGILHNFTLEKYPGHSSMGKFRCGIQWFMMTGVDFFFKYQF